MTKEKKATAERLYYVLGALFIAALITCNLIANKFISVDLGFKVFTISAGVLPYPLTFLITDILSELYGQKRTTQVVLSGLVASIFVLFVLWLGAQFPAISSSPVSDETYNNVFQNAWRVIAASMFAYLAAQLIDVRLFHFWKKITGGKMLWVRNNFSTLASQLVDTTLVVFVLFVGTLPFGTMADYIWDGWLFKATAACILIQHIRRGVVGRRLYIAMRLQKQRMQAAIIIQQNWRIVLAQLAAARLRLSMAASNVGSLTGSLGNMSRPTTEHSNSGSQLDFLARETHILLQQIHN